MIMTETLLTPPPPGRSVEFYQFDQEIKELIRSQGGTIPDEGYCNDDHANCPWCSHAHDADALDIRVSGSRDISDCRNCGKTFEIVDDRDEEAEVGEMFTRPLITRRDKEYAAWLKQKNGLPL